jgi:hypothetical protein
MCHKINNPIEFVFHGVEAWFDRECFLTISFGEGVRKHTGTVFTTSNVQTRRKNLDAHTLHFSLLIVMAALDVSLIRMHIKLIKEDQNRISASEKRVQDMIVLMTLLTQANSTTTQQAMTTQLPPQEGLSPP